MTSSIDPADLPEEFAESVEFWRDALAPTVIAFQEILIERGRQLGKGWTRDHDDRLEDGEIAQAAAAYALAARDGRALCCNGCRMPLYQTAWPWPPEQFKPKSYRENLICAAAMLIAEIERFDRRAALETS